METQQPDYQIHVVNVLVHLLISHSALAVLQLQMIQTVNTTAMPAELDMLEGSVSNAFKDITETQHLKAEAVSRALAIHMEA
jgi:hypothetical protein